MLVFVEHRNAVVAVVVMMKATDRMAVTTVLLMVMATAVDAISLVAFDTTLADQQQSDLQYGNTGTIDHSHNNLIFSRETEGPAITATTI